MATREATPTAIPMVVSELRRIASRRLRAASSVRSRTFIFSSPFVSGSWLCPIHRRSSLSTRPSAMVTMRSA